MVGSNIKFCITNFSTGTFFNKKIERSEIVGLMIFHSNSQVSIIIITYILLKCLPNKTVHLISYGWRPFYLQCQSTVLGSLAKNTIAAILLQKRAINTMKY